MILKISIISLLLVITYFFIMGSKSQYETSKADNKLFTDTLDYIKKTHKNQVKLYTSYDDGGMAEFQGIPAYIDPRAEVFVKENNKMSDVMEEYYLLQEGVVFYKKFLEKYKFTHMIIAKGDILSTHLPYDSDYQVSYSNDKYILYERIR